MKKTAKKPWLLLSASLFLLVSCSLDVFSRPEAVPKYIFLFIGDGMGANHIEAARQYADSAEARDNGYAPLRFDDFPATGTASTHNYIGGVTDSAAAATAIASGKKTSNGTINMNPCKTTSFTPITELMKARGRKVGIVSSGSLDSATPAAFYASAPSRGDNYDIALQLANSAFDFFGGGNLSDPLGANDAQASVFDVAEDNGFTIADTMAEVAALTPSNVPVLAVSASTSFPYLADKNAGDPTLAEFTRVAIDLLDGDEGFFIMAESAKIDSASHAGDSARMIPEVIALDEAIAEAVAFYNGHQGETLIVVTSDHETGGLTIADGESFDYARFSWSTSGHTGQDVKVFALGAGQEIFEGAYDNIGIFKRLEVMLE
ncbi:MAG TPA: alkaline phosphatase [Rectinemataceae bacterium]|nr:alkaline phosphatase [Rectinemataceae bacterium]